MPTESPKPSTSRHGFGNVVLLEQQVSICVPVYNGVRFVGSAVTSALSLKGHVGEVLVIDNCSTDGTYQCVAAMRDPRIRLVRNERNVGMVANFEAALKHAVGKYILFLPADDIVYPDLLERHLEVFRKHPSVGFVFSSVDKIDEGGAISSTWSPDLPELIEGRQFIRQSLRSGTNFVYLASCLCRRDLCLETGRLFDGMFFDWAKWLSCAARADVGYIRQPLAAYRSHHDNMTLSAGSPSRQCEELVAAVNSVTLTERDLLDARKLGIKRLIRTYALRIVVDYGDGLARDVVAKDIRRLCGLTSLLSTRCFVLLCTCACLVPRSVLRNVTRAARVILNREARES